MPELPEVEVVRLFLEDKLLHKTITNLEIFNPKSFSGSADSVIGQSISKFTRVGKQLSIHLSNDLILLVHLKMTGQLIYYPPSSRGETEGQGVSFGHPTKESSLPMPVKSTRLVFTFSDKSKLFFNDQRKFGWIKLLSQNELVESQRSLGYDIFDSRFTPEYLFGQLQRTSRLIKVALLDQHFFAGIGNIYANDALFLSGIHPQTPSNQVVRSQVLSLHQSLISIMQQSVLAGGSTTKDKKYVRPDGTSGKNQFYFRVYERKGEPCLQCGTPIEYLRLGGRGTFYCPKCQRL